MRSKLAGVEVEGVFLVASRVVGRSIESVEAVELVFDFGSFGEGETHATENLNGIVLDASEGMKAAGMDFTTG